MSKLSAEIPHWKTLPRIEATMGGVRQEKLDVENAAQRAERLVLLRNSNTYFERAKVL